MRPDLPEGPHSPRPSVAVPRSGSHTPVEPEEVIAHRDRDLRSSCMRECGTDQVGVPRLLRQPHTSAQHMSDGFLRDCVPSAPLVGMPPSGAEDHAVVRSRIVEVVGPSLPPIESGLDLCE